MADRTTTPQRILDAARRLFNERGFAATPLAEISKAVGIAHGNLTYHFPTKLHLVVHLHQEAQQRLRDRRASLRAGNIADDYVEHLIFAMTLTRDFRFLLRDRAQFLDAPDTLRAGPEMAADFEELRDLLGRIEKEGMFRRDLRIDRHILTRSLWIVSRYWLDYLRELEGLDRITWAEQERGIQHHFAVLHPCLTAAARREFEAALLRASHQREIEDAMGSE